MKRPAAARTDIAMDGQTEGLKLRMHKSHKTYFFSFESKRFPPCIHTHLDDLGLEHNSIIEGTNTHPHQLIQWVVEWNHKVSPTFTKYIYSHIPRLMKFMGIGWSKRRSRRGLVEETVLQGAKKDSYDRKLTEAWKFQLNFLPQQINRFMKILLVEQK